MQLQLPMPVPTGGMKLLDKDEMEWALLLATLENLPENEGNKVAIRKWAKHVGYKGVPMGSPLDDRITFDCAKTLLSYVGMLTMGADGKTFVLVPENATEQGIGRFWKTYKEYALLQVNVVRNNRIKRLSELFKKGTLFVVGNRRRNRASMRRKSGDRPTSRSGEVRGQLKCVVRLTKNVLVLSCRQCRRNIEEGGGGASRLDRAALSST